MSTIEELLGNIESITRSHKLAIVILVISWIIIGGAIILFGYITTEMSYNQDKVIEIPECYKTITVDKKYTDLQESSMIYYIRDTDKHIYRTTIHTYTDLHESGMYEVNITNNKINEIISNRVSVSDRSPYYTYKIVKCGE